MTSFWKRLMGRSPDPGEQRTEGESVESPEERRLYAEGVDGRGADAYAEQRLGGFNPASFVDDEFKP
jgi:hypothetical protein